MSHRYDDVGGSKQEPTAAEVLRRAWEAGRPIVPFLAAGISAGSGFPLISELNRYLLKTKFYIKYGAYRESFGRAMGRRTKLTDPENRTSQFLSDYGWPNFNQLDLELDHLSRKPAVKLHHDQSKDASMRDDVQWLDNIVGNTFKTYGESFAPSNANSKSESETTWQKYLRHTAASPKWGRDRWRLASACQHVLLEDIRSKDRELADEVQEKVWKLDLKPRSEWAQLLIDLAEGRLGLVDALLGGLGFRYRPGSSHVILAHLVKLLGIRLLLTTNFDPYIEQALEQEGASPRVLDIGRDAKPPDAEVVKQSLAVIKLHGSAYNLGFGERLDYELDEATRAAVRRYVPNDALLLVLGFSGGERRMMQLIEHLVFSGAIRGGQSREEKKIIWMHHEPESGLSFPVQNFRAHLKALGQDRLLLLERLSDAGEFLLDAYQRINRSLPKSRSRYSALPKRILPRINQRNAEAGSGAKDGSVHSKADGRPFHLFVRDTLRNDAAAPIWTVFEKGPDGRGSPSLEMSEFVAFRQAEQYRPVWVDLEEHHTISGVITEVVDKLRVYDPDLPPSVGSLDPENQFEIPMRLIRRALKRGRYILAFDSLDSFGRKQTVHHGVPVMRENDGNLDRVRGLIAFMLRLCNVGGSSNFGDDVDRDFRTLDWYCCVACDEPIPRHLPENDDFDATKEDLETWSNVRKEIKNFIDHWPTSADPPVGGSTAKIAIPKRETDIGKTPASSSHLQQTWFDSGNSPAEFRPSPGIATTFGVTPESTAITSVPTTASNPTAKADFGNWHRTYLLPGNGRIDASPRSTGRWTNLKIVLQRIHEYCVGNVGAPLPNPMRAQMQDVIKDVVKRSLDEFLAILMAPDSDLSHVAWLRELDAAYCMLAVFRRPLNFVSIQAVWSEFLPARAVSGLDAKCDAIDEGLSALYSSDLLYQTKGGLYWLPHHVHAWTYKAISEPMRQSWIYGLTREKYRQALASGALADRFRRLVFLMLMHSRAARHYYLTVFQCSHDQNALFECFYHLISALRYAKISDFYWSYGASRAADGTPFLSTAERQSLADELGPSMELLDRHEGLTRETHEAWLTRNSTVSPRTANADSVSRTAVALRTKLLQEVLNVLRREDETIRSTGSADTWLAWFQELKNDLPRIAVSNEDSDSRMTDPIVKAAWTKSADDAHLSLRRQIEWYLSAVEARLHREKRDSRECIRKRIRMLETTCMEALSEVGRRVDNDSPKPEVTDKESIQKEVADFSQDAQQAFGLVKAVLEAAFKTNNPDNYLSIWRRFWELAERRLFPKLSSLFGVVRNADELSIVDVVFGGLRDVTECLIHITQGERRSALIERLQSDTGKLLDQFETVSGTFLLAQFPNLRRTLEILRHDLELDKLRFHSDRLGVWSARRFDAIGRVGDNRSMEHGNKVLEEAVSARHRLRGAPFLSGTELVTRLCQFFIIEAQSLACLERFDDAVQVLDLAGNGLDEAVSEHRFLASRVHRRRADAAMRRVDCELRRRANPSIDSTRARLHEADKALLEAERLLRNGRRDVEEWRCLYETKAQLQVEHLLLQLSAIDWDYDCRQDVLPFVACVHGHLQAGLDAIRGGLDCVADPVRAAKESSPKPPSAMLISWFMQWLQLMTTGHLALIRFAQRRRLSNAERSSSLASYVDQAVEQATESKWETEELVEIESFSKRWTGLNRAAGLDLFVAGDVGPVKGSVADSARLPGGSANGGKVGETENADSRSVWIDVLKMLSELAYTPLDRAAEMLGLQPLVDPPLQSRELVLRFAELWFSLSEKPSPRVNERHAVVKLFRAVYSPRPRHIAH